MVVVTAGTWQKNGVEMINFNDEKWLNEKHRKTIRTLKSNRNYLKILKMPKKTKNCNKQPCRRFLK